MRFNEFRKQYCEDMKLITQCELLILNRISWKIYLSSPTQLVLLLLNNYGLSDRSNIIQTFNDWVYHCFSESDIYYKYDQFKMTLICLYLTMKQFKLNDICKDLLKLLDVESILAVESSLKNSLVLHQNKYKYNNSKVVRDLA